jgi:SAM-dependent methyltransferase
MMKTIDEPLMGRLRCPACRGSLARAAETVTCAGCGATFPVAQGAPVLIDESKSLFRIADCIASAGTEKRARTWKDTVRGALSKITPSAGENLAGKEKLALLAEEVRRESNAPRVLILGGASLGAGTDAIALDPAFSVVESDVVLGPRTNLICDAHEIPFEDATFDAVIAQAVFEYIIDPFHVADEIHRVLRPRGFVYAESPFMQQVHGGAYDFFRFTHLGHRRLFRRFEEMDSGVVCGPGMAFSWSYRYLLRNFVRSSPLRALTDTFAITTSAWLTRLDRHLKDGPAAYDAASAFYFLGRRSETTISDREIVAGYRGGWRMHR